MFRHRRPDLSHRFLVSASFYSFLLRIDEERSEEVREAGCCCGGRLHKSNYPRKPRGGPDDLGKEHNERLSFCCDQDGCRRRATPPSVRFFGRRVYLSAVVTLVAAILQGATAARMRKVAALVGDVSDRTLKRWRSWWQETFTTTEFWREHGARLSPALAADRLPASLIERFAGHDIRARLVATLRFLSPLTTAWLPPAQKK